MPSGRGAYFRSFLLKILPGSFSYRVIPGPSNALNDPECCSSFDVQFSGTFMYLIYSVSNFNIGQLFQKIAASEADTACYICLP